MHESRRFFVKNLWEVTRTDQGLPKVLHDFFEMLLWIVLNGVQCNLTLS